MERKEGQEIRQGAECVGKRKASHLILTAQLTHWQKIRPTEPEHSRGAWRCHQRILTSTNEQLIISPWTKNTLYFVVWPMKYIELLTVELCREVRRGEATFEKNWIWFSTIYCSRELWKYSVRGLRESKWSNGLFRSCAVWLCVNLEN